MCWLKLLKSVQACITLTEVTKEKTNDWIFAKFCLFSCPARFSYIIHDDEAELWALRSWVTLVLRTLNEDRHGLSALTVPNFTELNPKVILFTGDKWMATKGRPTEDQHQKQNTLKGRKYRVDCSDCPMYVTSGGTENSRLPCRLPASSSAD